jgi:hypothetical protein
MQMIKTQRTRKRFGPQPTGPAACWRSDWITGACCVCGEHFQVMHKPTRQCGTFCARHCPACNVASEAPAAPGASVPLPDARGAVLANAGAHGGTRAEGSMLHTLFSKQKPKKPESEGFSSRQALLAAVQASACPVEFQSRLLK